MIEMSADSGKGGGAMSYFRGLNWNVLYVVIAQMLVMTTTNIHVILSGLVGAVLAPVPWLATLAITVQLIAVMLTTLPASLLMARFGRRPIFLAGGIATIIAGIGQGMAVIWQDFSLFILASAVLGMGMGVGQFYRFAAADTVEGPYKPKALSLVLAGGLFAAFIGPEVAYRTPELIDGALYAGCFFTAAALMCLIIPVLFAADLPKPPPHQRAGRPVSAFFAKPEFVSALLAAALGFALMSFVMTATPLQMVNVAQFDIEQNARVIQWHVIGMFAPSFITGVLIARFGVRPILWSGVISIGLCLVIALSGHDFWHYFIALIWLGIGWNFLYVGGSSVIASLAEPEERGRVQGVADFIISGTVAVASLAAGLVHNLFGWQQLLSYAFVPLGIIAISLLLIRVKQA